MIDLDETENAARKPWYCRSGQDENLLQPDTIVELITRLRQAEKLNAELKDRMSHIGMDVGIATTGQVPGDHPIKSRLEMVAKLAKDAARYRWLKEVARHDYDIDDLFDGSCDRIDAKVDECIEAMQCK